MKLITFDPGKHTGIAVFDNKHLIDCGLFQGKTTQELTQKLIALSGIHVPNKAVVEVPKIYPQRSQKGDPNDLIKVAIIAGIIIACMSPFCLVKEIYPQNWKGNRPKKIDNKYVLSKLTPKETKILENRKIVKSKQHNVIDAIGIGLWILRRR